MRLPNTSNSSQEMRRTNSTPAWKLLPGVTAGAREYFESSTIAEDYDDYFAYAKLFELDQSVVEDFLEPGPGQVIADLGCGTGRSLLPLVRQGVTGWAVDLSQNMLAIVQQKADREALDIHCLRANLVQLGCLAADCFDGVICLFSTLGMVHGHENRRQVVSHLGRILRPQGRFVVHVHNYWHQLTDPGGVRFVLTNVCQAMWDRRIQRGDRYFPYRGLARMYLHTFTPRELKQHFRAAGLHIDRWLPLCATQGATLDHPWLLSRIRASGWLILGHKP